VFKDTSSTKKKVGYENGAYMSLLPQETATGCCNTTGKQTRNKRKIFVWL